MWKNYTPLAGAAEEEEEVFSPEGFLARATFSGTFK
jgi:hypothetical protein